MTKTVTREHALAEPSNGAIARQVVAMEEDGLQEVDLSEPPVRGGALVAVSGLLRPRLPDGTEWSIATSSDASEVVLELGDQTFISAS